MNIQCINLFSIDKRCNNNLNGTVKGSNYSLNPNMSYPNLNQLSKDTVSFGIRMPKKSSGATIGEHLTAKFDAEAENLAGRATTFLDIVEAVSSSLKEAGFSFYRGYAELHPVKTTKSRLGKIRRSGTFKETDVIRTTNCNDDPYDLSRVFDKLLPALRRRRLVVDTTSMTLEDLMKRGYPIETPDINKKKLLELGFAPASDENDFMHYTKDMPDIDFRLKDIKYKFREVPDGFRYCLGKPQKSGYEDIQIRLVRTFDKHNKPYELIIQFGPESIIAKTLESTGVYDHLREFGELHMNLVGAEKNTNAFMTNSYIEAVQEMFREKVSKNLFENAKNIDYKGIDYQEEISFSEHDKNNFEKAFRKIRVGLKEEYQTAIDNAATTKEKNQLKKDLEEDRAKISKIYKGLKETIKYFNREPGWESTKLAEKYNEVSRAIYGE